MNRDRATSVQGQTCREEWRVTSVQGIRVIVYVLLAFSTHYSLALQFLLTPHSPCSFYPLPTLHYPLGSEYPPC